MSRILNILILFMLWMAWSPDPGEPPILGSWPGLAIFLGMFAILVLVMGMWSRMLAQQVGGGDMHRHLRHFNCTMALARAMIPAWFAAGLFVFGWGDMVGKVLGPPETRAMEVPALLLGTLPPILAWMGLWWSQYPAERALREQNILIQLNENLPIHAPPGFRAYFLVNLRLQLLFTMVPVLLILSARDVLFLVLRQFGVRLDSLPALESTIMFAAAGAIFVLAPEILRRILDTQSLPPSPLRQRLESLCRQHRLGYRDILLWKTQSNMGNAAVMGVLPQVRYILLSDLLLETMTDQHIEAVFAHELGHVVHRHLLWYALFIVMLTLAFFGVDTAAESTLATARLFRWLSPALLAMIGMAASVGVFVVAFGYLSRRFERQADVFAARTMTTATAATTLVLPPRAGETDTPAAGALAPLPQSPTVQDAGPASPGGMPPLVCVGPAGASLFASALHRVAVINNIPETSPSWCHGSVAKRMHYLRSLALDPARTLQFDRAMSRVRVGLVAALLACAAGAWAAWRIWPEPPAASTGVTSDLGSHL